MLEFAIGICRRPRRRMSTADRIRIFGQFGNAWIAASRVASPSIFELAE